MAASTVIEARAGVKPSARQVYCLAHLMSEALGVSFPSDRREASELIGRLRGLGEAQGDGGGDDCPF